MKYVIPALSVCGAVLLMGAEFPFTTPAALTAHEWGTFTSIAGNDGMAVDWEPLDGPTDLPCFVHRFEFGAKALFMAKVRMETPVIYLYGPEGSTASVRVTFPHGYITEWYPIATRVATYLGSGMPPRGPEVRQPYKNEPDSIEWPEVRLARDSSAIDFPLEQPPSRYYAGRKTDSAALMVGSDKEKFLFYRGLGTFQPPVAATVNPEDRIVVKNLGPEPVPASILFENHDGKISWRAQGPIAGQVVFERPQPAVDAGTLRAEIERILIAQGLFEKEAKAMIATWGDSWFEEGTRLFYFLPSSEVDAILPLEIHPAPAHIARVFVGRMEIFTPSVKAAIRSALAPDGDLSVFEKYGRFLNATTLDMKADEWWSPKLSAMRLKYLQRDAACGKTTW